MKTKIFLAFLFALFMAPQYLRAQTYQGDTATINRLLKSAKSKRFSDSATAFKEAYQALDLAKKHNDGYWIFESYHRLGRLHESHNEYKKAHPFFVKELEYESNLEDSVKSIMYLEAARSYQNVGDLKNTHALLIKNEALSLKLNNLDMQQVGDLQFGVFYTEVNEFEKATQHLMRSIEISIKRNYPDEICESYRLLGNTYLKSLNYDLALKCAEKSMSYIDKIDTLFFPRYLVYISYGRTLKDCKKYREAIAPFEKTVQLCEAVNDKPVLAKTLGLLGDTYTGLNDLKNAEIYYKKCALLMSEASEKDIMEFAYNYGKLLLKKGEYDNAIWQFNKSAKLALEYEKKSALQKNYECLSDAFEQKNDPKQSLFYIKKALVLRDSIFSEENTKRIAEAQFKYDLAQSEEDVKKVENRQFYTILISISIFLCFSIAFLVYFLRSKNQKNKLLLEKTQMLTETTQIIKDKNRQLEESNEVLRQFAFASAHDLKEPLRSINSFVNIIQKRYIKLLPPEAAEYMDFVTVGVKRMESLLNALLEFSSVLIDDNTAHKDNDVSLVLQDVFQHCEGLMNEKNAVIRYPSVFPTVVMNEAHLKPILFNLVHNALKFSKVEAKIEIGYALTENEFILSVKDEGMGMDASYGDKIFKLFQRLDRVTHKESAGIGLTICKKIMDKYEGRIWFDSVVNEGTTFYISFPKSMISDVPSSSTPPQYLEHVAADLSAAVI